MLPPMFGTDVSSLPPGRAVPPKGGLSAELTAPTFAAAPLHCRPRGGLSES